jgi:hypothetical protein
MLGCKCVDGAVYRLPAMTYTGKPRPVPSTHHRDFDVVENRDRKEKAHAVPCCDMQFEIVVISELCRFYFDRPIPPLVGGLGGG